MYLFYIGTSIEKVFRLFSDILMLKYRRMKWRILHSPDSPIMRYKTHRNSLKIAKEFAEIFKEKN